MEWNSQAAKMILWSSNTIKWKKKMLGTSNPDNGTRARRVSTVDKGNLEFPDRFQVYFKMSVVQFPTLNFCILVNIAERLEVALNSQIVL